jgi:hypothetical protein
MRVGESTITGESLPERGVDDVYKVREARGDVGKKHETRYESTR